MMSKSSKIWLIIATSLVLVGIFIFSGAMTMIKWDFMKLSTNKFETNQYEITEDFNNITIDSDTADVLLVPSQDAKSTVVCYEHKNSKHTVVVKDDTLFIELVDTRNWYEHLGFSFDTPKVTVTVPKSEYGKLSVNLRTGDVEVPKDFTFESIEICASTGYVNNYASAKGDIKINTSTGAINVKHVSATSIELCASTGKVTADNITCSGDVKVTVSTGVSTLTDVTCSNLTSVGDTGDLTLKNVVASENFSIQRSTGDVKLESSDANELTIKTDTGDIKGSLLTEKVFITNTDTGDVDVPKLQTGGMCKMSTNTGDIIISID